MTDPDQIRWYWTSSRFAGCNVGVATGPSGLVVVDLDLPKSADDVPPDRYSRRGAASGLDVFALVCADAGQPVPQTFTVRTARGGRHLYFRTPAGTRLRNTEGEHGLGLGWHIDTRAWGGHVVGPGSITPDGRYDILDDRPVAELPQWLARALSPKSSTAPPVARSIATDRLPRWVTAAVTGECDRVARALSGHGRALFISAATLGEIVGAGLLPPAEAKAALYATAADWINSGCGCTDREIRRAITNGLRLGQTRPRQIPA